METTTRDGATLQKARTAGEDTGCCVRFEPTEWQERELRWYDKPFVKEHVRALFYVPVGLEKVFAREQALIESARARAEPEIVLSDETSLWGADYYFAVTKDVPGACMARLSGTFLTKVFDGPYRGLSSWIAEMREYVASRGKQLEKLYFWYTTCPKCSDAYGHNYVVLFAKTVDAP